MNEALEPLILELILRRLNNYVVLNQFFQLEYFSSL